MNEQPLTHQEIDAADDYEPFTPEQEVKIRATAPKHDYTFTDSIDDEKTS